MSHTNHHFTKAFNVYPHLEKTQFIDFGLTPLYQQRFIHDTAAISHTQHIPKCSWFSNGKGKISLIYIKKQYIIPRHAELPLARRILDPSCPSPLLLKSGLAIVGILAYPIWYYFELLFKIV